MIKEGTDGPRHAKNCAIGTDIYGYGPDCTCGLNELYDVYDNKTKKLVKPKPKKYPIHHEKCNWWKLQKYSKHEHMKCDCGLNEMERELNMLRLKYYRDVKE